jgi:site-specific DNA-methyltransferase (cytosine-N4-specific)
LLCQFGIKPGDTVLDPFAGSCTTLLVAQSLGINAVGIELLPNSHFAWEVKRQAYTYNVAELDRVRQTVRDHKPPPAAAGFPHLAITESAFPDETERDLMAYTRWFEVMDISKETKDICRFALMSLLESISYTRKDGQYLRWDGRAAKIRIANEKRAAQAKKPIEGIDKGELPSVRKEIIEVLDRIRHDVVVLQLVPPPYSCQRLIEGSSLYKLSELDAEQFAAVITSPPYVNRYDYTRTYALELAYLGAGEDIFKLRQALLSCTVENRPKLADLRDHYKSLGREGDYQTVLDLVRSNAALHEINRALRMRLQQGEINNAGVLSMVDQYFTELTFIYAELFRVCGSGASVAFVNDNVRYAGEIIPVDLLCTDLAQAVGFEPEVIYVLPQRKGNSSQQMGRYGRVELRKSITVWKKT